jgi:hypothetical protein
MSFLWKTVVLLLAVACGGETSRETHGSDPSTDGKTGSPAVDSGSALDAGSPALDAGSPAAECRQFLADNAAGSPPGQIDCICEKCGEAVAQCARVNRCTTICNVRCYPTSEESSVALECIQRECGLF